MPVADVTYHSTAGGDVPVYGQGGYGPIGLTSAQVGASQQLDFSGGPVNGAAAASNVMAIVLADVDCRVAVGEGVSATVANSRRIKANIAETFHVRQGERLSVRAA